MSNHNNQGGFTLIEVMVAMLITFVGLLGLLQAVNVATEQNLKTAARDEAMQITEDKMSRFRATVFEQISSLPNPYVYTNPPLTYTYPVEAVKSRLRGVSKNYTVIRTVTQVSATSKMIQVQTRWAFKNTSTSQTLQSIVSKPTVSN